jgi:hypothetical protein
MIYIKKWTDYYEDFFPIEPNQFEFFSAMGDEFTAPAKFLSVECGPALLSEKLQEKHDVTLTDSFAEFVQIANTRQANKENPAHVFNLNPADIARYLGKNFFNVIVCLCYRIIFMKDRTLIKKFLFDSKMLLSDGGYLVLDILNFSKYDFSETKIDLPPKKAERATLYSSVIKNSDSVQYKLFQHVVTASGKVIDEVKDELICPISMETIRSYAKEVKYSSCEFFSDYNRTPYTPDSDKIICVLKK